MDTDQDSLDWTTCREGRSSELCRRATFLLLFTPDGRPQNWLIVLGVICALVASVGLGAGH